MHDVWSRFTADPRDRANASLRASDADRDVAQGVLSEAYADGRLDAAEHEELGTRLATARTLGDLLPLLDGLVPVQDAVPAVRPRAEAAYRSEVREAVTGLVVGNLVCWAIWFFLGASPFVWPVFVLIGTSVNLVKVLMDREGRTEHLERRIARRDRKQLGTPEE